MEFIQNISSQLFFLRFYLFTFKEGKEGEREGNINVWLSPAHPLLGTRPAF